jgi:hypothetical protein
MNQKKGFKNFQLFLVALVGLLPTLLFIYICRFQYLQNDDFYLLRESQIRGVISTVKWVALGMNTRIVANFFWFLIPHLASWLHLPLEIFIRYWTGLMIFCGFGLFFFWIQSKEVFNKWIALVLSSLLTSLFFVSLIDHSEFIYYVAGQANYYVPVLFFGAEILLLDLWKRGQLDLPGKCLAIALVIMVSFFHELIAFTHLVFWFLWVAIVAIRSKTPAEVRRPTLVRVGIGCFISVAGFLFFALSSTNHARSESWQPVSGGSRLLAGLKGCLDFTSVYFLNVPCVLTFSAVFVASALFFFFYSETRAAKGDDAINRLSVEMAFVGCALASVPLYGFLLSFGTGSFVGNRVAAQAYFLVFLAAIWAGYISVILHGHQWEFLRKSKRALAIFFLSLLIILPCTHQKLFTVWKEATVSGPSWRDEREARLTLISAALQKGERVVEVAPIAVFPSMLSLGGDLTPGCDPKTMAYGNRVWAEYYGLDRICLK